MSLPQMTAARVAAERTFTGGVTPDPNMSKGIRMMTLADCMAGTLGFGAGVRANLNAFCDPNNLGGEAEEDCYIRLLGLNSAAGVRDSAVTEAYNFCRGSRMARLQYGDGQYAAPNW